MEAVFSPTQLVDDERLARPHKDLLLDTYWRITDKIDSPSFHPKRLLYLLVEEISLMLDVLVVRVSANPSLSGDADILRRQFSALDMNVSQDDYTQIKTSFRSDLTKRCLDERCFVPDRLQSPVGSGNNTVRFIDSALVLPLTMPGVTLPLGAVEIYYAADSRDVPDRSPLAKDLLQNVRSDTADALLKCLLRILTEAVHGASERARRGDHGEIFKPSGSVRKGKLEFLKKHGASAEPEELQLKYEQYFKPINEVLKRLRGKFAQLPGFHFSYRHPEDDDLSFFFTAEQVHELLSKMDVNDFKHLWTYPYKEGGLNGYVLKTAHPVYLPNQHEDSRWKQFATEVRRDDTEIDYDPRRQRQLLLKLFDLEEERLHTYIVPILFAPLPYGVFVAMHYTTNRLANLTNQVRKRMFDLAWESYTAMELGLIAQETTTKTITLQEELKQKRQLVSFSGLLGHTVPKFVFKPLEYYIQRAFTDVRCPPALWDYHKALMFFNSKGQSELQWYLRRYFTKKSDQDPKPWTCQVKDVLDEVAGIFDRFKELTVAGRLDRYDTSSVGGRNLRELARSNIILEVGDLRDCDVTIAGAKESHVIGLWNIIDNALDSFELSLLNKQPETKFVIRMIGSIEGQLFKLSVSNNGSPMTPSIEESVRSLLEAAASDSPEEVDLGGRKVPADAVKKDLRGEQKNKENPCEGLHRTAIFLHDLPAPLPGFIKCHRETEWTIFDLYIPKRS